MPLPDLTVERIGRVVDENDTVVLSFWAPWCSTCRSFEPTLEAAAEEHPDVAFYRVDSHDQQQIAKAFDVIKVPQLVVIRDRIVVASQPGKLKPAVLEDLITKIKALDMGVLREEMESAQ